MDNNSIHKCKELMQKYPQYASMIGMSMMSCNLMLDIHRHDLARLALLSTMLKKEKILLKKYRIKLELRKPFLQKTYELFGKAV